MSGKKCYEAYIAKMTIIHGKDAFTIDEKDYINISTKCKIKCNKCGNTLERCPNNHLRGGRCKCGNGTKRKDAAKIKTNETTLEFKELKYSKITNTKEFIERAENIYSDSMFNYNMTNYINPNKEVNIFCNKCKKIFTDTPYNHLEKQGCINCANSKYYAQLKFIKKAKELHGDKYLYDRVKYRHRNIYVEIGCIICEKYFIQTPDIHLRTLGCSHYNIKRKSPEKFIEDAKAIHGDLYLYDKAEYKLDSEYVTIGCTKCNNYFPQTANCHLRGYGCPYCAGNIRKTNEEFIEDAKAIHGDRYRYDKVEYKNCKTYVNIGCPLCETYFPQTPSDHLSGYGCPNCKFSAGERLIKSYLDDMKIPYKTQFSIDSKKRYDFLIRYLIVEYNGLQHFKYVPFFHHNEDGFNKRKQVDVDKTINAIKNGYRIAHLDYNIKDKNALSKHLIPLLSSNNDFSEINAANCQLYLSDADMYKELLDNVLKVIPDVKVYIYQENNYIVLTDKIINIEPIYEDEDENDLPDNSWKLNELIQYCRDNKIKGYSGKNKTKLIEYVLGQMSI